MNSSRAEIERHEIILINLLRGWKELQAIQGAHSQAILELARALREAGINPEGVALPSTSEDSTPASQNAEAVTGTA